MLTWNKDFPSGQLNLILQDTSKEIFSNPQIITSFRLCFILMLSVINIILWLPLPVSNSRVTDPSDKCMGSRAVAYIKHQTQTLSVNTSESWSDSPFVIFLWRTSITLWLHMKNMSESLSRPVWLPRSKTDYRKMFGLWHSIRTTRLSFCEPLFLP